MKYGCLFFISVVLFFSCRKEEQAQIPIYQREVSDTVKSVLDKARELRLSDLSSSLKMVKSAIELGHKVGDDAGLIRAYRNAVFVAGGLMRQPDMALEISEEAVAFAHRFNDANTYCDIYGMRAMVFQVAGQNDSATFYNQLAMEYMDKDTAPDSLKNWPLYLNSADHFNNLGNHRLAIEYTLKYLQEWAEVKNDTNAILSSYINLSVYYMINKDTAKAIESTQKAWEYNHRDSPTYELNTVMHAMYTNRNMLDSAYFFANQNLLLTSGEGDFLRYIFAVSDLMETISEMKEKSIARSFLTKPDFKKALDIYENQGLDVPLSSRKNFAYYLSEIHKLNNNDALALKFMTDALDYQVKLNEEQNSKKMEEFELERHRIEAENQSLAKQVKIESQRNTILILVFSVLALAGAFLFMFTIYRSKVAIQKKTIENLKDNEEWERERVRMHSQMEERNRIARELHDDVGASLTSLVLASSMLSSHSSNIEKGLVMIKKTAKETIVSLNEVVWTLNSKNDSLHSLSAYIRKFANSFLAESGISVDFIDSTKDSEVAGEKRRAIYLTMKEGLNNIVKHSGASHVELVLSQYDDNLQIDLSDDGRGFAYNEALEKGNGLGNMKRNIEGFGGAIEWRNKGGTEIKITCNL